MKYANTQIEELRLEVGKRLSEKRYTHTLGVEEMAVLISEKCMPERTMNEKDEMFSPFCVYNTYLSHA